MLTIPFVIQVLSHLGPADLLAMARSSKDLRSLLLHDSTMSLWKSAREAIPDLPPKPDHMSDPSFIALMFDTFCMVMSFLV